VPIAYDIILEHVFSVIVIAGQICAKGDAEVNYSLGYTRNAGGGTSGKKASRAYYSTLILPFLFF
jgi:hypothetical protein